MSDGIGAERAQFYGSFAMVHQGQIKHTQPIVLLYATPFWISYRRVLTRLQSLHSNDLIQSLKKKMELSRKLFELEEAMTSFYISQNFEKNIIDNDIAFQNKSRFIYLK